MNNIISPFQNVLVKGRQIQDNILIAHEVFHWLKTKKKGLDWNMAIKVDMQKAYDRVEWSFLEGIMHKMGFPSR